MDKYEYKLKAEQIKKLVNEENFVAAMKIADSIDWRRVKNVSMLCTVSDIYVKNEKYEQSHEVLLMAYDRSPIGRMIVYKLAELAIKMKDFDEAIEYYREFVHVAPGDVAADILKYKIYKAKGATAEELIPIMEAFKEREYHEEWAYELAHLYHEAGMGSKCIEECDEIILWFSEGKYVERAMELKMLYRPLTPEQQEKYDHRNDKKEEPDTFLDEDDEENEEETVTLDTAKMQVITEDMFSDALDPNDIKIKPVNVGKYDTINLQAELAKSMDQIMSATEKEAVDSTMENIRKLVEDSQILDINFDDELEKNEIKSDTLQVEVPASIEVASEEEQDKISYEKILAEENDGQISLYMPEANILEKQITGQMRIEDVLNEWDKMKQAAEVAIKEAEQKRLDEAKGKALQKAENIMSKLSLIISEEEMQVNGEEIAAALEESFLEEDAALAQVAASIEKNTKNNINDNAVESKNATNDSGLVDLSKELEKIENLIIEEDKAELEEELTTNDLQEDKEENIEKTLTETDETDEENDKDDQEDNIEDNLPDDIESIIADELDSIMDESNTNDESNFEEVKQDEPDKESCAKGLTKEQQEIFTAFLSVRGIEKALCDIFNPMNEANSQDVPFVVGNIAIIGKEQTGKTTLAMGIAKAVQIAQHKKSAKVAKISANSLNSKDIKLLLDKMEGGVLIIEKAGNLTEKTMKNVMSTIREVNEEIILILEDTKRGIDSVLERDTDFASYISNIIEIPEYNNHELVEFGKEYAKTLMYSIDDMAILALYTCLGNMQKDNEPIAIEQVKTIVDEAIVHSNKKKFKKLKDIIMKRRYDEEKRVILQECDFESVS